VPARIRPQERRRRALQRGEGDPVDADPYAAHEDAVDGRYPGELTPFDPALKQARAVVETPDHRRFPVAKGAFEIIARERGTPPQLREAAESLEEDGHRVLGVAVGDPPSGRVVGLLGLRDPPREDAGELITQLSQLGVRTVMVTGDAPRTARAIAAEVGIGGPVITGEAIGDDIPQDIGVCVLPSRSSARAGAAAPGHIVGMCDGPTMHQRLAGAVCVAVASATDIAGRRPPVLTTGLAGIVEAIREGRRVHQRVTTMRQCTAKKTIALLLALGLLTPEQSSRRFS
jgi:H+-transporting ATPase